MGVPTFNYRRDDKVHYLWSNFEITARVWYLIKFRIYSYPVWELDIFLSNFNCNLRTWCTAQLWLEACLSWRYPQMYWAQLEYLASSNLSLLHPIQYASFCISAHVQSTPKWSWLCVVCMNIRLWLWGITTWSTMHKPLSLFQHRCNTLFMNLSRSHCWTYDRVATPYGAVFLAHLVPSKSTTGLDAN